MTMYKYLSLFICFLPNIASLFANTNDDILLNRHQRFFQSQPANRTRFTDTRRTRANLTLFAGATRISGIVKNDFLLNDDTISGTKQQNPSIAINNQGNIVIGWSDFRDGNSDIYIQRMDTNNNFIGTNYRVNTDATMMWQGLPSVAIHNNGNFVVSWEDRRTWNSDVYLQRFNAQGQPVSDNIVVNDNIGVSDQRNCDVVILPNQNIIVVWDDWRNDWGDIFLQRFNSNGNRLGVNLRVNNDALGNTQYYPSIDYDNNGNFIITWMDGRQGDWNIYAQRFNSQAQPISDNFMVNDNNNSYQGNPKIAINTNGEFIVVWEDRRNGHSDIYAQRFDSSANRLGSNYKVNDDLTNTNQSSPNIVVHQSGNVLIVWTDSRQNNPDIYAQVYNQDGTQIGNNFRINDDLTNKNQSAPNASIILSGKAWIIWDDARHNHDDIYMQTLNSNMTMLGHNQKINDDNASAHQRCSWITQDGNGRCVIVWEDERDGNCNIYATRFDSLGNILNPNFKINDDIGNSHYYPSVATNFRGDFIVSWTDDRNSNFDIYAQCYNQSGTPIGSNFKVNDDSTDSSQWFPVVSCDSIGNYVIVWTDYRNNNYDVYGQLYDNYGNSLGTNFLVGDNTQSEQLYATVSRNRSGCFVITWMDNRNNNYDIYAQRYSLVGQPIGSDFRVNDTPNNNFQGYPNLALHDNGQFTIVWEDQRHYDTDIFLQRYNPDGTVQDNNIRVNSDIYNEEQYSPSIAYNRDGNYVVTWCYMREIDDDPEIFSQAFSVTGQRIGDNILVNQPDFFSANNQWLIGQGVMARNSRITYAWIDNRRHQGWDIYAKIVNWNFFTGVNEENIRKYHNVVNLYPNPSNGKIFLQSSIPVSDCKIYNSIGQVINVPVSNRTIDLSGFESGVYFIKYNIHDIDLIKKIVLSLRSQNGKK